MVVVNHQSLYGAGHAGGGGSGSCARDTTSSVCTRVRFVQGVTTGRRKRH